jgi:hypothetical protein
MHDILDVLAPELFTKLYEPRVILGVNAREQGSALWYTPTFQ